MLEDKTLEPPVFTIPKTMWCSITSSWVDEEEFIVLPITEENTDE